jgi:hypothetical protein
MLDELIRSRKGHQMRNGAAKASVVSAFELVEINFAFFVAYFAQQLLNH